MTSPATPARPRKTVKTSQRVPQLDGLRGVAVLLVVAGHSVIAAGATGSLGLSFLDQGGRGVTIFFVLSGFLITTILLRERARTGRISLSAFYTRRAFRILPAFYAYLAVIGALALGGIIGLMPSEWVASALFVWDYASHGNWWIGHTWSLAVEEQFYLVWPLVLLALPARRLRGVAIDVIIAAPVVRTIEYLLVPGARDSIGITFHTRVDALALGSVLSLAVGSSFWDRIGRAGACLWPYLTGYLFVVAPLLTFLGKGAYLLTVGWTIEQLVIAVLICTVVTHPRTLLARALAWRPLTAIGAISYSLYLWQQPYLAPQNPSVLHDPLVAVPLALLTASASYWIIERPFLRLKRRFERGTADFQPAL